MDKIYWIWLMSLKQIGNSTRNKLLDYFDSPEEIFHCTREDLNEIKGLKSQQKESILSQKDLKLAEKAECFMKKHQICLITRDDDFFPQDLKEIYNPPAAFFTKGNLELLNAPLRIGIVGSRKASPGGLAQGRRISRELSQNGVTVVSGFAAGIDRSGHEGALEGIGSTIAVLGCGINICYPKSNQELYHNILKNNGLVLTEFFMDEPPIAFHFPLRNRIISGLVQGLLVVEAAEKSGALITARHALEQGKNVYAIPKDISLFQSVGSNNLIKDGAKVVTRTEDILEDYIHLLKEKRTEEFSAPNQTELSSEEAEIVNLIKNGQNNIDNLVQITGKNISEINSLLSILELKDVISIDYGKITLL